MACLRRDAAAILHRVVLRVAMGPPAFGQLPAHRDMSSVQMIADGVVHAAALVAGVIGFSVLFQKVALRGAVSSGVAMTIYAVAFFLLFGFSRAYNMARASRAKWLLRHFDHASI
jgi:hemolysin III